MNSRAIYSKFPQTIVHLIHTLKIFSTQSPIVRSLTILSSFILRLFSSSRCPHCEPFYSEIKLFGSPSSSGKYLSTPHKGNVLEKTVHILGGKSSFSGLSRAFGPKTAEEPLK